LTACITWANSFYTAEQWVYIPGKAREKIMTGAIPPGIVKKNDGIHTRAASFFLTGSIPALSETDTFIKKKVKQ
jgi:hypothetical protein